MQIRTTATVTSVLSAHDEIQILETEFGPAIAYTDLVTSVVLGDSVLLNRTARTLGLGTGGYDFVIANLREPKTAIGPANQHVVKLRYSPSQTAVCALESNPDNEWIWDRFLDGAPVVVCQLHSQIAHCAAAAVCEGKRAVYVMTDSGSLLASFSELNGQLRQSNVLSATITIGQAFGGDFETVTIHSALLAARHLLHADVIIVGQGPGNVGTGTKYGFGGIEQASILDTVAALGGEPIAMVRVSEADSRSRHQGISHHTTTSLRLVRSSCTIPLPEGIITTDFEERHRVVHVDSLQAAFDLLVSKDIVVKTMGRPPEQDDIYFKSAAAAGRYASNPKDF